MENILNNLNKEQKKAVFHKHGPALIIAGAGTGKTTVITARIVYLIKEGIAKSEEILALTFTNKATLEMEDRIDRALPLGYGEIMISTFHSFCDRVLQERGVDIGVCDYKVLSGPELFMFWKDRMADFDLDYFRPLGNEAKFLNHLFNFFSRMKDEDIQVKDFEKFELKMENNEKKEAIEMEKKKLEELKNAYKNYQKIMLESNKLDFSDLIFYTLKLFRQRPNVLNYYQSKFKYILVDEYQDTNFAQNEIVAMLANEHKNIMVVGDDDQSIYKFRGASVSNILQFKKNYPNCVKIVLNKNYRSVQNILDLSYTSIQFNNPDRLEIKEKVDKKLIADNKKDKGSINLINFDNGSQEVSFVVDKIFEKIKDGVSPKEIAVLARGNRYLQPFTEELRFRGIHYQFISERGLLSRPEIKDLISLFKVIVNPYDEVSWFRVLRMPEWKISMKEIFDIGREAVNPPFSGFFSVIEKRSQTRRLSDLVKELVSYSRNHTFKEVLFKYFAKIDLYKILLENEEYEKIEVLSTFVEKKVDHFEYISADSSVKDFVDYIEMIKEAGDDTGIIDLSAEVDAVTISSIHGVKGLEFEIVFLTSLVSDRFPSRNRKDIISVPQNLVKEILPEGNSHLQEERRLFYVGITRAKKEVYLTWSNSYNIGFPMRRIKKESKFLTEIKNMKIVENQKIDKGGKSIEIKKKKNLEESLFFLGKKKTGKLSFTQLNCYDNCPRQYQYCYILGIPAPPDENLSYGRSIHNTLREFYDLIRSKIHDSALKEDNKDISLSVLLKIYNKNWQFAGYPTKKKENERKKKGRESMKKYYKRFRKYFKKPLVLEEPFTIKVGVYSVRGKFDRVDDVNGGVEVFDYKTGRLKSQREVDNDLQLSIYAIAAKEVFQKEVKKLTLHFIDYDKSVSTIMKAVKIDNAKKKIIELGDKIIKGDFTPAPNEWKCKYCEYKTICDAAAL